MPWTPVADTTAEGVIVSNPIASLVAEVGRYDDEIAAYLMFDFLRSRPSLRGVEVLLTYERTAAGPAYPIVFHVPGGLVGAIDRLAEAQAAGFIPVFEWSYVAPPILFHYRKQSRVFEAAYNLPGRAKLETMTQNQIVSYTRRFLVFKSSTDPRIRRQLEPVPKPLSAEEATRLASDILLVADFYDLPLDFFLGIGAIENNYMNVTGDLQNSIWKRRAEKDDVVLRRWRGRVLVLNQSSGVWQITQETLRYAHRLYLKDQRDYSQLPEHLRPSKQLNLREINPITLTTYAGLLFRDLLDRFDGDVGLAVGAYNGGPGKPNPEYEAGVRVVAGYARRVLEQAAALNGRPAAETSYFAPLPPPRGR